MQSPELAKQIKTFLEGDVEFDDKTLDTYSKDTSLFSVRPQIVVFPKHSKDVSALVAFVLEQNARGEKLTLTARSGGTDMSGGPLTESIVVIFGRYMNQLISLGALGAKCAVVEPGMFYRDFETETLKNNLLLPSYPASREICMMGGVVNNNSGGEKTLRYGKTARYVSKMNMILSDGNEYEIKKLTEHELFLKMVQENFEGRFYKQLYDLVKNNYDLLQARKPQVSKNSSGYALWDVYDPQAKTFDLTQLFVGAQGTLGLMTKAEIQLIHPKPYKRMLVIFMKSTDILGDLVQDVLKFSPESFESYDDNTMKVAIKFFPALLKRLKGSLGSLIMSFLPEVGMVLTGGFPKLVLLAEFTADSVEEALAQAEKCRAAIKEKYNLKMRVTQSDIETEEYWVVRRESFNLLRNNVHGMHTAPFIDDVVVNPQYLPEFLPKLNKIFEPYKIIYTVAGHVGDGNFHIIPLMDLTDPHTKEIIKELGPKVYDLVISYNGSITGEHNDGIVRTPYIEKEFGSEVYKLFVQTKKILDPLNIFNPGKKVGGTIAYEEAHLLTKNN
ncbi:MAG: FAD-binding oxidoreductase [Candidatus Paceibacterota bacterium]|jgi:FAD/FMN-containing dehydrogenase